MTFRESDGRIVPMHCRNPIGGEKPGNIGAGKAARSLRDPDRAPSVLSDGTTVIAQLDHIHHRAATQGGG